MPEPTVVEFERWVLAHYQGEIMSDRPLDFDPKVAIYYKIGERQYRIPIQDIEQEFGIQIRSER